MAYRIGFGYDVHRLKKRRPLILGGILISNQKGLEGHSDADVLTHAICDALLGAAALGDIGQHFPNTDKKYKNANSISLLQQVQKLVQATGYSISNVDVTLCAEAPTINPHIAKMKEALADALQVPASAISIKATTSEKMGFIGKEKGMAAYAAALIERNT